MLEIVVIVGYECQPAQSGDNEAKLHEVARPVFAKDQAQGAGEEE